MATYSKVRLSGSTQGRPILIAAVSSAGTTVHVTGPSATILDELTLFANNTHTANVKLTIEYGGTTAPNDLIEQTIPFESGLQLVLTGLPLSGDGSAGVTVRAFAATASVVTLVGYVNRYTP